MRFKLQVYLFIDIDIYFNNLYEVQITSIFVHWTMIYTLTILYEVQITSIFVAGQ